MPFGYAVVKKADLQPEDAFAEARRMAAISGLPNFELAVAMARDKDRVVKEPEPKPSAVEKMKAKAAVVKQKCTVTPCFEYHFQNPVKVEVQSPVKCARIKK